MRVPKIGRLRFAAIGVGVVILIASGAASSLTSTLIISSPITMAKIDTTFTPNNMKPRPECDDQDLTEVLTMPGSFAGTNANTLLLSEGGDGTVVTGGTGDDCLAAGAGTYTLDGGDGNDACVGNATTTFVNCERRFPPAAPITP